MLRELFIVVILSVLTVTHAQAVKRTECRHDDECGTGECCYYTTEPPSLRSKRDGLTFPPVMYFRGGWCEKYIDLGDWCDIREALNGHCSCGPNLKCKLFPFTTPSSRIVGRYFPPSDSRCVPA